MFTYPSLTLEEEIKKLGVPDKLGFIFFAKAHVFYISKTALQEYTLNLMVLDPCKPLFLFVVAGGRLPRVTCATVKLIKTAEKGKT